MFIAYTCFWVVYAFSKWPRRRWRWYTLGSPFHVKDGWQYWKHRWSGSIWPSVKYSCDCWNCRNWQRMRTAFFVMGSLPRQCAGLLRIVRQQVYRKVQHLSVRPSALFAGSCAMRLLSVSWGKIYIKGNNIWVRWSYERESGTRPGGANKWRLPALFRTMECND